MGCKYAQSWQQIPQCSTMNWHHGCLKLFRSIEQHLGDTNVIARDAGAGLESSLAGTIIAHGGCRWRWADGCAMLGA